MSYRVVYGETMPAWEKIFPTQREAKAFAKEHESFGDKIFSISKVVPGEQPKSLTAALEAANLWGSPTAMSIHFCPVCRRDACGHLYAPAPVTRDEVLARLALAAKTPVDMGTARFAADLLALFAETGIITQRK